MDRYDDFNILSRSLTEISADITEVLTQLDGFVRRVDGDIDEFTKLAHRLQDEITQARMVPIGNLYTRLSRTVRDAAKAAGKQVELALEGAETELDNNIIQQISDPLMHLVRNAVAHGIERAEERYDARASPTRATSPCAPTTAAITSSSRWKTTAAASTTNRFAQAAVDRGADVRRAPPRAGRTRTAAICSSIRAFPPLRARRSWPAAAWGSTWCAPTPRAERRNRNRSEKGRGTRFTLKVPLTLIISQALFVRCGTSVFAFPLAFVEEIRRLRPDEIEEVGGKLLTQGARRGHRSRAPRPAARPAAARAASTATSAW